MLTIRLRRRIPWYTAASAIDLAHRTITVTATEQVRRDHPQNVSARITDLGTSVENGSIDFDPPKVGRNLFLRGDHFVRAASLARVFRDYCLCSFRIVLMARSGFLQHALIRAKGFFLRASSVAKSKPFEARLLVHLQHRRCHRQ